MSYMATSASFFYPIFKELARRPHKDHSIQVWLKSMQLRNCDWTEEWTPKTDGDRSQ